MNDLIPEHLAVLLPDNTLPQPDEVSYYVLERERKIYMDTPVGPDVITIHRLLLRWNIEDKGKPTEERKPVYLYIMSDGGDADYMRMLVDAIVASVTPVYTVNIGAAYSGAALIFIAGHKRFMTKNAKIIIHEGSAELGGDAQKVQDQANNYKKFIQWMKEFILNHTSIPKSALMRKRSNDWELDATYCLAHNVCDAVIETLDEVI